jgi:thioredoxin-like negative regulator of GroEL
MRPLNVRSWVWGMCLVVSAAGIGLAEPASTIEGLAWQKDLRTAREVAVRDKKPMMLVFGAEWCGYCKKLESTTLANPQMVKYINSTFVPVHIDVDKDPRVAKILEVESLPCTIILSAEADLLGRIEGFETPSSLYQKLAAARQVQARISQTGTQTPE